MQITAITPKAIKVGIRLEGFTGNQGNKKTRAAQGGSGLKDSRIT
jgi:hypothetical protein